MMSLLFPSPEFLNLCFSFFGFEKVNGLFPFSFQNGKYMVIDSLNGHSEWCLFVVICANWKATFLHGKWNYFQCWHISSNRWNKWTVHVSWNHSAVCLQTYLLLLTDSQSVVNQCHTRWRLWSIVTVYLPVPLES